MWHMCLGWQSRIAALSVSQIVFGRTRKRPLNASHARDECLMRYISGASEHGSLCVPSSSVKVLSQ
jgi:hypothetical protein